MKYINEIATDEQLPLSDNIKIFKYKFEDLEKYPDKKFYYFFHRGPCIENLFRDNNFISDNIIYYFQKFSNLNIVILNLNESESFLPIKIIHDWAINLNLDQSRLWIVFNNKRLLEYKNKLKTDINFIISDMLISYRFVVENNFYNNFFCENKEGHFFMCHNGNPRRYRIALIMLLKHRNLLQYVDWSLIKKHPLSPNLQITDLLEFFNSNEMSFELEFINSFEQKKSHYEEVNIYPLYETMTYHGFEDILNGKIVEENAKKTFKNSYFNIVTETNFGDYCDNCDDVLISEKSFKPFLFYQFPIIVASHQHIKFMREYYNFDFFDDIIDHSYDNEINVNKRLKKIVQEIERINSKKDFFIDFYKRNKNRFINNHNKLLNLYEKYNIDMILEKLL